MRFSLLKMKMLVLALALGATCCLTVVASRATAAYFQDTKPGTITGTLSAGAGGPYLSLAPGCSKKANPCSCGCPKGVLIASADTEGNLSLDFGGVYQGSSMAWADVFDITSSAPDSLQVSFTVSGGIAPLVASVGFAGDTTGGALDAGETRSVAVKLSVASAAAPGTYGGTLVVAVVGTSESYSIPMVIKVLSRKCHTPPVLPVTSCDYDGHWHNGPVTLNFSVNDCGGPGVAYTEYSLDNGSTWTQGTSLTITSAGTTTLLYHSVDVVGNVENAKSVSVKIDLTPPTTTATALPSGWSNGTGTLTLAASDSGGSGVKAIYYKIGSGAQQTYTKPIALTSAATVTYWTVDNAGNIETPHSFTPQIDTVAPTTAVSGIDANWHNTPVTVTLTATDSGGAGVKATYYTIDGTQYTYTAPFSISSQGSHTVTYWSVDNAGNTEAAKSCTVKVDTVAPTTTVSGTDANWHKTAVKVTLTATDGSGSGVKATYYTIDGTQYTYTAPFSISSQASHTVTYWSVDNVGNTETAKSCAVKIDLTAPVVSISAPANGASYKKNAVVKASWTATDALSGINAALTKSTPVANGVAIDTSTTGSKTFTVTATDNAGNVTTKTVTYTVTKN